MKVDRRRLEYAVGGAVVIVLFVGGILAATLSNTNSTNSSSAFAAQAQAAETTLLTVTTVYDPNTQSIGPCALTTPPAVDPCIAAQSTLRYSFWDALVNATLYKNWVKSNPGEYARIVAHMTVPKCSEAPVGQVQDMITQFGAALYAEVQAYNCALGTEPIAMPAPNPPPTPGAKDKTPPSPPGPVQEQTTTTATS